MEDFFFDSGNFIYLYIYFIFEVALEFVFPHACSALPLESPEVVRSARTPVCSFVCVCVAYVWKGNDGSDTETGWCSSDGGLEAQAACSSSPSSSSSSSLQWIFNGQRPRRGPETSPARQTPHSVLPSHIAITKTALHVSAMYVASIKENIKKRAGEQGPKVKDLSEDSLCVHAGNTRIKLSLRGN